MPAYNNYFPMQYQPFYQAQPSMSFQTQNQSFGGSGIVWVNSEQEAQNYPVAPNNAVALWDVSNPVIYLKQADSSGRPILKIYDIVERQRAPQKPSGAQEVNYKDFAEKREIKALRADIDDIRSKIEKMNAEKANGGVESVS